MITEISVILAEQRKPDIFALLIRKSEKKIRKVLS